MLVYTLPIFSSPWSDKDTKLLSYVSAERRQKVMRYVHVSDRKLSLYAALTARMGLSQVTGIPVSELIIDSPANHKPRLINSADYDFSFSHTRNFVLCCISEKEPVGADVEKISNAPFEIMEQVFHPEEIQYVQSAPNQQKEERFFEIWTRKEAYTKLLGVGLVHNLTACNTLTPTLNRLLYTWRNDVYMCSIGGKGLDLNHMHQINESDIWEFFCKT